MGSYYGDNVFYFQDFGSKKLNKKHDVTYGAASFCLHHLLPQDYYKRTLYVRRWMCSSLLSCAIGFACLHNLYFFTGVLFLLWSLGSTVGTYVCSNEAQHFKKQFQNMLTDLECCIDQDILNFPEMSVKVALEYLQQEEKWLEKQTSRYALPDLKLGNLLGLNKARQSKLQQMR